MKPSVVLSAGLRPHGKASAADASIAAVTIGNGAVQEWQLMPSPDLETLPLRVLDAVRQWHRDCFALKTDGVTESNGEDELWFDVRDGVAVDGWWLAHVLTPLALYRICLPLRAPQEAIPLAFAPTQHPCQALGPLMQTQVPGLPGRGHLHYLPSLGHFLLQPEVTQPRRYVDAEAVFAAWQSVIQFRQRVREQNTQDVTEKTCSRRGFLRKLAGGKVS